MSITKPASVSCPSHTGSDPLGPSENHKRGTQLRSPLWLNVVKKLPGSVAGPGMQLSVTRVVVPKEGVWISSPAAGLFNLEAALLKFSVQRVAVIPLDFDHSVFDRTAGSAFLFQTLRQCL